MNCKNHNIENQLVNIFGYLGYTELDALNDTKKYKNLNVQINNIVTFLKTLIKICWIFKNKFNACFM